MSKSACVVQGNSEIADIADIADILSSFKRNIVHIFLSVRTCKCPKDHQNSDVLTDLRLGPFSVSLITPDSTNFRQCLCVSY